MSTGGVGSGGAASAGSGDGGASASVEPAGYPEGNSLGGITAAHNRVRRELDVGQAAPLPPLVWSPEMAAVAQAWADMLVTRSDVCTFPPQTDPHSGNHSYGENIFFWNGAVDDPEALDVFGVVDGWAAEADCYTYGRIGSNDCDLACTQAIFASGCGHYTQIVWRGSSEVGCGYASCPSGSGDVTKVWVCNYFPVGNYVDEFPY
ncbi:MAG: CAP domain-containing protein [Polyangiaceae bacterium]|nr:CAP domain-containing protein [Polyangiaceae bacterium]